MIAFVNQSKLIRTSREYQRLYKKILEARNILTQKLMKEPSNREIAFFLEIDEKLINEVMKYQDNIRSLDEVIIDDGKKITLLDQISLDDHNINSELFFLREELANLSNEELELINLRYFQDRTQSEIAAIFGTNQVQISRNEQKILKKLKNKICQTQ